MAEATRSPASTTLCRSERTTAGSSGASRHCAHRQCCLSLSLQYKSSGRRRRVLVESRRRNAVTLFLPALVVTQLAAVAENFPPVSSRRLTTLSTVTSVRLHERDLKPVGNESTDGRRSSNVRVPGAAVQRCTPANNACPRPRNSRPRPTEHREEEAPNERDPTISGAAATAADPQHPAARRPFTAAGTGINAGDRAT